LRFDIFSSRISSRSATDRHLSYDLHRAANITKREETVFHSLAETLWHDSMALQADGFVSSFGSFSTWYLLSAVISVPLTILSFIGVLYMFYRVRVLNATVTAAHFTVHKVAALDPTVPSFLSYFTTPIATNVSGSASPVDFQQICKSSAFTYITLLLFGLFGILLVITKLGFRSPSPNSFTLVLEIGHQSTVIYVVAQSQPGCLTQYRFSASKFVERIAIVSKIRPSLQVTWFSLHIFNIYLDAGFDLTKSIPFSLIQAYRFRKIITGPFWRMLTARYGHFAHRIDLVKTDNQGIEENPSSANDRIPTHSVVLVASETAPDTPHSRVLSSV